MHFITTALSCPLGAAGIDSYIDMHTRLVCFKSQQEYPEEGEIGRGEPEDKRKEIMED
jgi:hypothetical protein